MKSILSALRTAGAVAALGLAGVAVAADNAVAVTQWDITHQNLVREFSQGLGADLAAANAVLVARTDAAAGSTEQRIKKTKHAR